MSGRVDKLKFDQALRELEKINEKLETGNLDLEEALRLYQEGLKLYNLCQEKFKKAKAVFEEVEKKKQSS